MKQLNIKYFFMLSALSLLLVPVLSGCGSSAQRIDPATQGLTTVKDINTRDWNDVATLCIDSLVSSGALVRGDGRKTVIMISEVKNSTSRKANTTILTNKLRQAMLKSGKAVVTSAVGVNNATDSAVRQVRELENDEMFNQSTVAKNGTVIAPDMSLSGEIIRDEVKSGRTTENYFQFHVVATDLTTGLAIWEDSFDLSKQETANIFGF